MGAQVAFPTASTATSNQSKAFEGLFNLFVLLNSCLSGNSLPEQISLFRACNQASRLQLGQHAEHEPLELSAMYDCYVERILMYELVVIVHPEASSGRDVRLEVSRSASITTHRARVIAHGHNGRLIVIRTVVLSSPPTTMLLLTLAACVVLASSPALAQQNYVYRYNTDWFVSSSASSGIVFAFLLPF